MKRVLFACLILFAAVPLFAQPCKLSGTVTDSESGAPLQFTHIWIKALNTGTTTDSDGNYTLTLAPGSYIVRVSYMGYHSSTAKVTVKDPVQKHNFTLRPNTIEFPEIVVLPGENPAIPIIRKAIEARKRVEETLDNYKVDAHTKLTIHFKDYPGGGKTQELFEKMQLPFESITTAYWSKTGERKEIIEARKQVDLGRGTWNMVNSMPARVNFSKETIPLRGYDITGPISENGLDAYWYDLLGTSVYDSTKVYKIAVTPRSDIQPLISGTIYIADSTYLLIMVDVEFNKVARGAICDFMSYRQQFTEVDGYWMPTDVVLKAILKIQTLFTMTVDVGVFSVLKDYNINDPAINDVFDDYQLEISPIADDIHPEAWQDLSMIPSTEEEQFAYHATDSMATIQRAEEKEYHFGHVLAGKHLYLRKDMEMDIPGLITMYRFNRIQGHGFSIPFSMQNISKSVKEVSVNAGYGWSDKRAKWSLGGAYWLDRRNDITFDANIYSALSFIDHETFIFGDEWNTALNAIFGYDPRDYFYRAGWEAGIGGYVLPWADLRLHGGYDHYENAQVNIHRTVFGRETTYDANPEINPGYISRIGFDAVLDFRARILDKGIVRRGSERQQHFPTFGVEMNEITLPGERWNATVLSAGLTGEFGLGGFGSLQYRLAGKYADTKLPTQRLFNLQGSEDGLTAAWRFRTANFREFGGDRIATAFAEWNLGFLPFSWTGIDDIPVASFKTWEFIIFGGAGWTDMREETFALQQFPTSPAKTPFYELGFGINGIMALFRLDFAWRMNHFRDGSNFFIGLSFKPEALFGE